MVKPHFFKRALCEVLSLRSLVWLVILRTQRFDGDLGWAIRMLGCWCGQTALESAVIVAYRKADGVHTPPPLQPSAPHTTKARRERSCSYPSKLRARSFILHQHSFIPVSVTNFVSKLNVQSWKWKLPPIWWKHMAVTPPTAALHAR